MYKCKKDFECYREGVLAEFKKGADFRPLSLEELGRMLKNGYIEEEKKEEEPKKERVKPPVKPTKTLTERIKEATTKEALGELKKEISSPYHKGLIKKMIEKL